jgi:hypothetical protein
VQVVCQGCPICIDEDCKRAFGDLKNILMSTPIIQPPNWGVSFEIMCNALDYAIGAVFGECVDRLPMSFTMQIGL